MKVQSTVYKGIEFVSFQELPVDQQLLLQHNTEIERIIILLDGKVCRDCIQYKDYSAWYSFVFLKSVRPQTQYTKSAEPALPVAKSSEFVVEV